MNNETCPHCGAEKVDDADRGDYSCDTFHYHDGSIVRGYICYERQLAVQAAEIELLKADVQSILGTVQAAVQMEREACAKLCDSYSNGRHSNAADLCAEAIRARGEVK